MTTERYTAGNRRLAQIESNISQIELSLQSIQSSSKAQNLLIMYNMYETRKIRKSLI